MWLPRPQKIMFHLAFILPVYDLNGRNYSLYKVLVHRRQHKMPSSREPGGFSGLEAIHCKTFGKIVAIEIMAIKKIVATY
jgi:hypothetical protein